LTVLIFTSSAEAIEVSNFVKTVSTICIGCISKNPKPRTEIMSE